MSDETAEVDLKSPDLAAAKRAAFEELFPGLLADGVLDAGRLGELLDTEVAPVADARERFGLMWAGKQQAVQSLLSQSRGTLVPDVAASVGFDTAENVFIEGDNLEVLKLLQKSYNDKVKLIYIDPPYNTGNDFVYNDDFADGLRGYLAYSGQLDDDGNRLSTQLEVLGRRHSRWLSMMYPRLALARNLLTADGYLLVSISDVELQGLRLMLDEVFGEENYVETFIWRSIFRPSNMSKRVRRNAEYVVCYRRTTSEDFELVERLEDPKGEASLTQNNNAVRTLTFPAGSLVVKLADGTYQTGPVGDVRLVSELVVRKGRNAADFRIAGKFKWSQQYLDEEIAKGVYLAIKTDTFIPYYRKDYQKTTLRPTKILPDDLVGDVLQANAEVDRLLPPDTFDYPKPTSLMRFLLRMTRTRDSDVVLDFFAGSGSTAHAVALENAADGGRRRCVSVNLPEAVAEDSAAGKAGFATVSDICLQRIQRVMQSVGGAGALGLRTLRLGPSNFREQQVDSGMLDLEETTLRSSSELDGNSIAAEVFLNEGVPLHVQWERHRLDAGEIVIADGVAVVLSKRISPDLLSAAFDLRPRVLIFLEDGFAQADALKANAVTNARNARIALKTV